MQDIFHRARVDVPNKVLDDVAYLESTCCYLLRLVANKYGMLVGTGPRASGGAAMFLPIAGSELPR